MRLCVLHNLYFYNHLMEDIRGAIEEEELIRHLKKSEWIGIRRGKLKILLALCRWIVYYSRDMYSVQNQTGGTKA